MNLLVASKGIDESHAKAIEGMRVRPRVDRRCGRMRRSPGAASRHDPRSRQRVPRRHRSGKRNAPVNHSVAGRNTAANWSRRSAGRPEAATDAAAGLALQARGFGHENGDSSNFRGAALRCSGGYSGCNSGASSVNTIGRAGAIALR